MRTPAAIKQQTSKKETNTVSTKQHEMKSVSKKKKELTFFKGEKKSTPSFCHKKIQSHEGLISGSCFASGAERSALSDIGNIIVDVPPDGPSPDRAVCFFQLSLTHAHAARMTA